MARSVVNLNRYVEQLPKRKFLLDPVILKGGSRFVMVISPIKNGPNIMVEIRKKIQAMPRKRRYAADQLINKYYESDILL